MDWACKLFLTLAYLDFFLCKMELALFHEKLLSVPYAFICIIPNTLIVNSCEKLNPQVKTILRNTFRLWDLNSPWLDSQIVDVANYQRNVRNITIMTHQAWLVLNNFKFFILMTYVGISNIKVFFNTDSRRWPDNNKRKQK